MAERAHRIELEMQGRPEQGRLVPLRTFAHATESLTDLLTQVAEDRSTPVAIEWFVSGLHEDNAVLTVEGSPISDFQPDPVPEIVRTTLDALEKLEQDEDVRDVLSYTALEKAHLLADLMNDGASSIIVRGSGHEVSLTVAAAGRAEKLLTKRYGSIGSVEGMVETVSEHEAGPFFVLRSRLHGNEIDCRCDLTLLAQAKAALGVRVRVVGRIEQRYDGRVESVEATDLYIFPPRDQLPQVSDIRGIYAPGE